MIEWTGTNAIDPEDYSVTITKESIGDCIVECCNGMSEFIGEATGRYLEELREYLAENSVQP